MTKLKVDLSKFDVFRMQLYLLPRLKINYFWFLFFLFFVGVGSFDIIEKIGIGIWLIAVTVIGFIFFLLLTLLTNFIYSFFLSEKYGVIGEQLFEISEREFIETTKGSQTRTVWSAIQNIYKNKNYIYVQISGYRIHILPKRSFEDFSAFNNYWQLLKERCDVS